MANQHLTQLVAEAKRLEEDSLHSAKGHFAAAEGWTSAHYWVGLPIAILSGISGVLALAKHPIVGGTIAVGVAILTAVATFFNPSKRSGSHLVAGNAYKRIQNRSRRFYNIDAAGATDAESLKMILDSLATELDDLNEQSPKIPRWAYKRALAAIATGEASYAVDKPQEAKRPNPR
jgi:hypothetical protein